MRAGTLFRIRCCCNNHATIHSMRINTEKMTDAPIRSCMHTHSRLRYHVFPIYFPNARLVICIHVCVIEVSVKRGGCKCGRTKASSVKPNWMLPEV